MAMTTLYPDILVPGAPNHELTRSKSAQTIGELSAQSHLFLSHFEHRYELPLPEEWLPEDRADLGEIPQWQNGLLPETKYQGFRHDRLIGSFHPGHRAKWTAHELCHGLVGFAWKRDANRFFHALAARLAEVLPVALWYFYDEGGLRRCPIHQGHGPLYRTFCPACEAAATQGALDDDPLLEQWYEKGQAFVAREIDAVHQSLKTGRMVPHPVATLELGSDALAYAAAHTERLNSDTFKIYSAFFCKPERGFHSSLDSIIARIQALSSAITEGTAVEAWVGDRWTWAAQDVGWRLLQLWTETEGEAAESLFAIVEQLATEPSEDSMAATIESYADLTQEWDLPDPEDIFAVGYDLGCGHGRSAAQVLEGIASGMPATCKLMGENALDDTEAFVLDDLPVRAPLVRRFSQWVLELDSAEMGPIAQFEATLCDPPKAPLGELTLAPDVNLNAGMCRGPGGEVLSLAMDAPAAVDSLLESNELPTFTSSPVNIAIVTLADGELGVLSLSEEAAELLQDAELNTPVNTDSLSESEVTTLVQYALLVPEQYTIE